MKPKEFSGDNRLDGKVRLKSRPKTCPVCGSKRIAAYLYGMPMFSEELEKKIDEGKIVLGGCCISDDDPVYKCMECETDFYRTTL